MSDPSSELPTELACLVECLLFVADSPVTVDELSRALEAAPKEIEAALLTLDGLYERRGLRLQRHGQRVQIVTAPEVSPYIERFLGLDLASELSTAALESLAIVAYRQPVTRAQIEAVRGVNCDSVLRTLTHKGLVEAMGRLDQAGRPIVYGTTFEFLQYFGFSTLEELPALDGEAPVAPSSGSADAG